MVPTYNAVALSVYTLIPTGYRPLLKSVVSITDYWFYTSKEKEWWKL